MYKQKELYKYCITAINCEFLKTYSVCLTEFKTVGILATSLSSTQKCKFFSFSLSVHAYFIIYFVDNCTVKTPIHAVFRSVKICVISLTVQQTYENEYVFIILTVCHHWQNSTFLCSKCCRMVTNGGQLRHKAVPLSKYYTNEVNTNIAAITWAHWCAAMKGFGKKNWDFWCQ